MQTYLSSPRLLNGDTSPYGLAYPPSYVVEATEFERGVPIQFNVVTMTTDATRLTREDEEWHVLVEAYRGMFRTYGSPLVFSCPKLATSLVYRSEREYLEDYDQRFAWSMHCYTAKEKDHVWKSGFYAGFLFVRPWQIHCNEQEESKKEDARNHRAVAPAICEGYAQAPHALTLSPAFARCLGHYAEPYGVLPFPSIPFAAARFGAACGHSNLWSALLMSGVRAIFSPYELAIASTTGGGSNHEEDNYHIIKGLKLSRIDSIISRYCKASADYSVVNIGNDENAPSKDGLCAFAERVCSFLFQGIPVIFDVDHKRLYGKPEDYSEKTNEEDFHTVLIHSVARSNSQRGDGLPFFVFSDSTDLHTTGRIFRVASCEDLVKARLRGGMADRRTDTSQPENYEAVIAACMPIPSHSYIPMGKAKDRCELQLPSIPNPNDSIPDAINKYTNVRKVNPALRSRSQLSGYLLKCIFPDVYTSPLSRRAEMQGIQKILDSLEIPAHVWVAETPDRNVVIVMETIQNAKQCFHAIGFADTNTLWIRGPVHRSGIKCWQVGPKGAQSCSVSEMPITEYPVLENDL